MAKGELTDEELDALDTRRYKAAVSVLLDLEGMKETDVPQMLSGTEDSPTSVTSGDTTYP